MAEVEVIAEKTFRCTKDQLDAVTAFIVDACGRMGYPESHLFKLEMCIEEIFVNVCNYAYPDANEPGEVRIHIQQQDDAVIVLFADTGIPFNPLEKEEPDLEERARKRTVGGLGIHLVRKFMDEVTYEYIDGENRLAIIKIQK